MSFYVLSIFENSFFWVFIIEIYFTLLGPLYHNTVSCWNVVCVRSERHTTPIKKLWNSTHTRENKDQFGQKMIKVTCKILQYCMIFHHQAVVILLIADVPIWLSCLEDNLTGGGGAVIDIEGFYRWAFIIDGINFLKSYATFRGIVAGYVWLHMVGRLLKINLIWVTSFFNVPWQWLEQQ